MVCRGKSPLHNSKQDQFLVFLSWPLPFVGSRGFVPQTMEISSPYCSGPGSNAGTTSSGCSWPDTCSKMYHIVKRVAAFCFYISVFLLSCLAVLFTSYNASMEMKDGEKD